MTWVPFTRGTMSVAFLELHIDTGTDFVILLKTMRDPVRRPVFHMSRACPDIRPGHVRERDIVGFIVDVNLLIPLQSHVCVNCTRRAVRNGTGYTHVTPTVYETSPVLPGGAPGGTICLMHYFITRGTNVPADAGDQDVRGII